jgi:hypothetical protein
MKQVVEPAEPRAFRLFPMRRLRSGVFLASGLAGGRVRLPQFPPATQRMQWFRADSHNIVHFCGRPLDARFFLFLHPSPHCSKNVNILHANLRRK